MFSADARRLAGVAGALLGWRPDEFWKATPAELATVLEALAAGEAVEGVSRDEMACLERMFPDG